MKILRSVKNLFCQICRISGCQHAENKVAPDTPESITGLSTELLDTRLNEGWRQGAILSRESSAEFFEQNIESNKVLVVVTQTCDLFHSRLDLEPYVELFYGEFREGPVPKSAGKSFREFELKLDGVNGEKHLYVLARPRLEICREKFLTSARLHEFQPNSKSLTWFSRWLGEKYSRAAFPNSFDRKLHNYKDKIAKAVKHLDKCRGMYLTLSSWEELPSDDVYKVSVLLLLKPDANEKEKEAAEFALTKIIGILAEAGHYVEEEESLVEMVDKITLHDFMYYTKWSLDYVSIRNPEHAEPVSIPT